MKNLYIEERRGPTPDYRLLQAQCARMDPQGRIHWAVRPNHITGQWVATACFGRIPVAVATRGDMGAAMRALLGKLFEMEGESHV